MARIFGLDIPEGLENLFSRVVALRPFGDTLRATLTTPSPSHPQKTFLREISLFIQLEPTWDTFLTSRRDAWQAYWETLPFGSHSGSRGWPGSGFSAFVYVNAPRIRAHLDLLLDPPAGYGSELVGNPDFATDEGWDFQFPAYWEDGAAHFPALDDFYDHNVFYTLPEGLENGDYHVEIEISVPGGITPEYEPIYEPPGSFFLGGAGIGTEGSGLYVGVSIPETESDHFVYTADVNYTNDPATNLYSIEFSGEPDQGEIVVHRVSLKKIL